MFKKTNMYGWIAAISVVSIILSVLLYLSLTILMGEPAVKGVLRAAIIPAIIAPLLSYGVFRILENLDAVREELRESQERYKSIVENSHDGILIVDEAYRFTYVNSELCNILGYPADEILGQDFRRFLDSESQKIVSGHYTRRQQGEPAPAQYEFNVIRKDGEKRRVEIRSTVKLDVKGRPQTIAQLLDISSTRKAQAALRKSEKQYRDIFENTGNATVIIEKNKIISMANTEFEHLSGYTKVEIEGRMRWTQFVLAEDLAAMAKYHAERREKSSQAPTTYEFRFVDRSGNVRNILNRVNMISGTDKSVASLMDITDIIKAKSDLKESEEKFRSITAAAKDAIIMMNAAGDISYWNQAAERMFGFSSSEMLGNNLHDVLAPSRFHAMHRAAFPGFQKTGCGPVIGRTIELTGMKKNGAEFPIELSVSGLKLEDKWHAIGIVRDVSQRKKLEGELRQAHKMEAMGTLAGGIAHDFNNILGAIIGYAELAALDAPEDSRLNSNLQGILRGGNRARELVKQILTFSRLSDEDRKPIYIDPIVKEALNLLRASLPATIDIRQHIESDCGTVLANATQLHQVFMNLCTNASHAMGETGGILNVRLEKYTAARHPAENVRRYIRLTISDTGHGIAADIKERIFEPYFTTKQRGEGTGLGLSVVHGIVKSHEGTINVRSEPGQGAAFEILLPTVDQGLARETTPREPLPVGNEHVLFVDDEQALVDISKQMLTGLGYRFTATTSSPEALAWFTEKPNRFDLVITDQTMPHMTGKMLTRQIKALRPDIPVILCTGFSTHIDDRTAKANGIDAFVTKPIVMREMAATIRNVLDTRHPRQK